MDDDLTRAERAPWFREDALSAIPPAARPTLGTWGYAEISDGNVRLKSATDAGTLSRSILQTSTNMPTFVYGPEDEHLRTVYEVDELAAAVEERSRQELASTLRRSLPRAGAAVALVGAAFFYRPADPGLQQLIVLVAIFVVVPLWQQGVERAWDAWRGLHQIERDPVKWRRQNAGRLRFQAWTHSTSSLVGRMLVASFVLVFVASMVVGLDPSVAAFGLVKDQVNRGEVWRLLSCAFLHGGLIHIFFNSIVGLSLANIARSLVDEKRILVVFLLSALAGSVASWLMTPATSIGASGGILGWGGLLLGMAVARPDLRGTGLIASMLRWILLLALIGIVGTSFIDNAAHAGGFLAGTVCGLGFGLRKAGTLPIGSQRLTGVFWVLIGTLGLGVTGIVVGILALRYG